MSTSVMRTKTPTIPEFYAGRSLFITGGTGFLGKVLIEKLLRSCPDIKEIYVLMRPKRNKAIDERLRDMLELPLFDRIKEERPGFDKKIIPVNGDISVEGLGLGPVERRHLQERVSVVFHVAANIRFDDPLKQAIFTNIRSTRDVCNLAHGMKNLVALVHVSSTYAQSDKPEVKETVYPVTSDWKKVIKIAENLDDNILRSMTPKFVEGMPNTYTFTKRIAEQVIVDYSKELPTVIYRPSIVISTLNEPMPGWMDNFNGPAGLLVGGGKGILRICLASPNSSADYIPVDITTRAMITASWKRGLETVTRNPEPHVYNSASQSTVSMTNDLLTKQGIAISRVMPLNGIVWYPSTHLTDSIYLYYVLAFLLHIIPAYLIDRLLVLSGNRPMLMKLQRKVYISNCTLSYFVLNEWKFHSHKFLSLLSDLLPEDVEAFGYDFQSFSTSQFLKTSLLGGMKYLLKENIDDFEPAKRNIKRMWWLDRIVKTLGLLFILWALTKFGFFTYVGSLFDSSAIGAFPHTS